MAFETGEPRPRIGEILVQDGALRAELVECVLVAQQERALLDLPARFGEVCVRKGWVHATQVARALALQTAWTLDNDNAARVLMQQGRLAEEGWARSAGPCPTDDEVAERLLSLGLCEPEELRKAEIVARERRAESVRRSVWSSFAPLNLMEALVAAETARALERDRGCACTQCWANIAALALNGLAPRYVTEGTALPVGLGRYGADHAPEVVEAVSGALAQVRANPKMTCLSRFSDEILTRHEADTKRIEVTVRISARHVHLAAADAERLFGPGHQLAKRKDLAQPGQFAAQETVCLVGPKGTIDNVRILGPYRAQSQVEISGTDQFQLGVSSPVRESGRLEGSAGIRIVGPAGSLDLPRGVIRAQRHVHMLPEDADRMGLRSGALVPVRLNGDRPTVLEGALVRAAERSALEMHIDTDEANASGVGAESVGYILIPVSP